MIVDKILVCTAIVILTATTPYWSFALFVIVSPWSVLSANVLGWDPRVPWSLVLFVRAILLPRNNITKSLPTTMLWGTTLFVVVSCARLAIGTATIPSDELSGARMGLLYFFAAVCGTYAIIRLTNYLTDMGQLISPCAWSLIASGSYGLVQAWTDYVPGLPPARISGSAGNPNYFAAYLSLGATAMLLCWRLKLPMGRLCVVAALTSIMACLLTFSRMGAVACVIGCGLTLYVTKAGKTMNWRLIGGLLLVLLVTAMVARSYLANVRNTASYASGSPEAELALASQEAEDLTRLEAASFAFGQFLSNPVFGAGFSTIAERNYAATGWYVTTHDTYAQISAGTGLVGVALLVWVAFSVLRSMPASTRIYIVPVAAVVGFSAFFADFLQSIEMFIPFAVLIGLLRHLGTRWADSD